MYIHGRYTYFNIMYICDVMTKWYKYLYSKSIYILKLIVHY